MAAGRSPGSADFGNPPGTAWGRWLQSVSPGGQHPRAALPHAHVLLALTSAAPWLVPHGEVILWHMRREEVDEEPLLAALREHGLADLGQAEIAVLEMDGSVSVEPAGQLTQVCKPRQSRCRR